MSADIIDKEPLTPEEYQHWKDTGLIDGDIIDRFAATLDFLFPLPMALINLESVTRSYLRYPLEGKEPGYDAENVLAYCDEARDILTQCPTCKGNRVVRSKGEQKNRLLSCPDCKEK